VETNKGSRPVESADVLMEHLSCSFAHLLQKLLPLGIR